MNYIIIGIVLNFLLSIIFYNINENKKITNLYFTGITSFIFFLLNSYWVYIEIDIYNLYLNNIWWYSIPYSMFLFGWLFVIFIYKLYSDKKEKTKKTTNETTIDIIKNYSNYVSYNYNYHNYDPSFDGFAIMGFINEGWATVDINKANVVFQRDRNNSSAMDRLKQISNYNKNQVFIAKNYWQYFGIYATNNIIFFVKIEDIKLIDRTKM